MGDRVLIQLVGKEEVSPVLYQHWGGAQALGLVERTRALMGSRGADVSYSFARLVGLACADTPAGSNLGVGVWNASERLTANDSHGDAGIVLVHVGDGWRIETVGGYLSEQGKSDRES